MGRARLRPVPRTPRVVLAVDPVRQARGRPLRSGAGGPAPRPRDAHGRRARRDGCRRIGAGRRLRRLRGRSDVDAVRRDLPGAHDRARRSSARSPTSPRVRPSTRRTRPGTSRARNRRGAALEFAREQIAGWGAPGHESDDRLVAWLASYMRKSASPSAAVALELMNRADQRLPCAPVDPRAHADDRQGGRPRLPASTRSGTPRAASRAPGSWCSRGASTSPGSAPADADPRRGGALRGRARRGGGAARPGAGDRVVHRCRRLHREGLRARGSRLEGVGRGAPPAGARPARPVPRRGGRHGGRRVLRHLRRPRPGGPVRAVDRRRGGSARHRASGRACTRARSRRSTGRWAGWPW